MARSAVDFSEMLCCCARYGRARATKSACARSQMGVQAGQCAGPVLPAAVTAFCAGLQEEALRVRTRLHDEGKLLASSQRCERLHMSPIA